MLGKTIRRSKCLAMFAKQNKRYFQIFYGQLTRERAMSFSQSKYRAVTQVKPERPTGRGWTPDRKAQMQIWWGWCPTTMSIPIQPPCSAAVEQSSRDLTTSLLLIEGTKPQSVALSAWTCKSISSHVKSVNIRWLHWINSSNHWFPML
jgi:hypothetical protein